MHRKVPFLALLLAAACATPTVKAPVPSPIDAHFVARQRAMARMAKNFERVHFEFDSSRITLQTRDALFANVELMRAFPEISLEIEGHCDEVGSVEYNLALGERRAAAIKRYMVAAGVASGRVHHDLLRQGAPARRHDHAGRLRDEPPRGVPAELRPAPRGARYGRRLRSRRRRPRVLLILLEGVALVPDDEHVAV